MILKGLLKDKCVYNTRRDIPISVCYVVIVPDKSREPEIHIED